MGYSYADWAGLKFSRQFPSRYVFLAAGGTISTKSKKQTAVATSSAEAEYMALKTAALECGWFEKIFAFAVSKTIVSKSISV